jgi:hypothetical protein
LSSAHELVANFPDAVRELCWLSGLAALTAQIRVGDRRPIMDACRYRREMSVRREIVVRTDTDVDATDRARLLGRGLIEANIIVERPGHKLPYGPGPAAATVLEPGVEWIDLDDNGVDIDTERSVYHSLSNWARPNCNRCGTQPEREAIQAAFEAWTAGPEPTLTCPKCGWTTPVADWPAPWPFGVGGRTRIVRVFI